MARTELAVQQVVLTGLNPVFSAATVDGHAVSNPNGNVAIYVKNAGGSPTNVTITTFLTIDGLTLANQVVAVAAGTEKIIGPFKPALYNTNNTTPVLPNSFNVGTSVQTSVTLAAIKI